MGVAAIDSSHQEHRSSGPASGTRGAPAAGFPPSRVGSLLRGTYRVLHPLEAGGMAVVYEALHVRLGRHVAIKFLARELAADAAMAARFRREAEVLARLNHPHIVEVLDFDTSEHGEPYLAMELLRGQTLAARLEQGSRLETGEVVAIASQLAAGLCAAHRASVVHRDLKPANVFLEAIPGQEVCVKLLDFGISKAVSGQRCLTREHVVLGTPEYMAPEQAAGTNHLVDARADQYSLAAIVYEMLAGGPPFSFDEDIGALLRRVVCEEPPALSELAPWARALSPVVMRGLAKQPQQRFLSILVFAWALALAHQAPAPARSSVGPAQPIARIVPVEPPTLVAEVKRLGASARLAFDRGDLREAAVLAEAALDLEKAAGDPHVAPTVARISELLERILITRLGGASRVFRVVNGCSGNTGAALTPAQAFLLSRVDDGLSLDETLDVSAMPRLQTLRLLTGLVHSGALAAG
jgi:tRNA A-37 threonylcarbamoyl transferase component Bud32